VRAEAARKIEAEGDGITRLGKLLADDPNAEVRAAAASQLSDSDSLSSINSLLTALNDPSTEVIVEALDSLLFVGDETIIPSIEPLLDHPEEIVRETARDTIDFLE
jgi:HEAT repeat protein